MSLVGGFPSMRELARRTVRGPVNPIDKSTLVSIYPRPIKFKYVTLSPGRWFLPAGSIEHPSLLTLGPSSWFRDVGIDEPLIEITQSSVQVAEALCKDYLNGMFGCNMADSVPGLFFIPGKVSLKELRLNYGELLGQYAVSQHNYYKTLVKYGEAMWARSNGNPLAINDEMRMAAAALGRQDVEWMHETANVGQVRCFACGEFKSPEFPICKSCHTIDPNHPKAALIRKVEPGAVLEPMKPENPFGNLEQ